jgi:hypothetical protein
MKAPAPHLVVKKIPDDKAYFISQRHADTGALQFVSSQSSQTCLRHVPASGLSLAMRFATYLDALNSGLYLPTIEVTHQIQRLSEAKLPYAGNPHRMPAWKQKLALRDLEAELEAL